MSISIKIIFYGAACLACLGWTILWANALTPEATPEAYNPPPAVEKQVSRLFILVDQVGKQVKGNQLKHKHRENYHDNFGADKDIYFGFNGKVRKYDTSYGSDDSMVSFTYIYDDQGRLRVVLTHAGYVYRNRSDDQTIFLDEKGTVLEVIHETQLSEDEDLGGENGKAQRTKEILREPMSSHEVKADLNITPMKDFKAAFEM